MQTGVVVDSIIPGRIAPDGGGGNVKYAPPAIVGRLPVNGDRVQFKQYAKHTDWASYVKVF